MKKLIALFLTMVTLTIASVCYGYEFKPTKFVSKQLANILIDYMSDGGKLYINGAFYDSSLQNLPSISEENVVIYINGIVTDREEFKASVATLSEKMTNSNTKVIGFYNISASDTSPEGHLGFLGQFFCSSEDPSEGAVTALDLDLARTCESLEGLGGLFFDGMEVAKQYVASGILYDTEAETTKKLARFVEQFIEAGKKVVIVAHSQGNLYAHSMVDYMLQDSGKFYIDRYLDAFGVVMVASPVNPRSMGGVTVSKMSELENYGILAVETSTSTSSITTTEYPMAFIPVCGDFVAALGNTPPGYKLVATTEDLTKLTVSQGKITSATEYTEAFEKVYVPTETPDINDLVRIESVGDYPCYPPLEGDGFIARHSFRESYLVGSSGKAVTDAISKMFATAKPFDDLVNLGTVGLTKTFRSGDTVIATDNLNVRTDKEVADTTYEFTARAGSLATVMDVGSFENGYQWNYVCFLMGAYSTTNQHVGGECGFVASNWLAYDQTSQPATTFQFAPIEIDTPNVFMLEKAPSGELTAMGGFDATVDEEDNMMGPGGCTNCSLAPTPFSITSAEVSCLHGEPRVNITWDQADGEDGYYVWLGNLFLDERTYGTFTHSGHPLIVGEEFTYTVEAFNERGTRTSNNKWRVEIPYEVCGGSAPPPPYDGPIPSVATTEVQNVELSTARLTAELDLNDVCTSAYFEYGDTEQFGNETTKYAIGCSGADIEHAWEIFFSCDSEVFYEAVAEHNHGEVRGGVRSFTTPSCEALPPTNLRVTHDVQNNDIIIEYDAEKLPESVVYELEIKTVRDPRPGVETGVWKRQHAYPVNTGVIRDVFTDPPAGARYCYRIRPFEPAYGDAGYGNRSDDACITIEGVFEQQTDFPTNVSVRVDLDHGLFFSSSSGGTDEITILRNVNGEGYIEAVTLETYGGIEWLDTDVQSFDTICYTFVQNGVQSEEEYCNTYFDSDDVRAPTLLSLERLDEDSVRINFTSDVPTEGWFDIFMQHEGGAWLDWGNATSQEEAILEWTHNSSPESQRVCVKVEQFILTTTTTLGQSNMLCLDAYATVVIYTLPEPPLAPSSLQVNGESNPNNIRPTPIRFSGVFHDTDEGDSASACQVQVSYDERWENPLWDSGRESVASGSSAGDSVSDIRYTGESLLPETPVYWRMRCFDQKATVGEWSRETASFTIKAPDPSMVAHYPMNGLLGEEEKQLNQVNPFLGRIAEYIGNSQLRSNNGYDDMLHGSYHLLGGGFLELGNVLTPNDDSVGISMWVFPGDVRYYQREILHAYSPNGERIAVYIVPDGRKGNLYVSVSDRNGKWRQHGFRINFSGSPFWKLDINISNGNGIEVYINGALKSRDMPGNLRTYSLSSTLHWIIGAAPREGMEGKFTNKFNGRFDEVKLFNRSRTSEEIMDDYLHEIE